MAEEFDARTARELILQRNLRIARLEALVDSYGAIAEANRRAADRYHTAWLSARKRAAASFVAGATARQEADRLYPEIEEGVWRHEDGTPCTNYPDSFHFAYTDEPWACIHGHLVCHRKGDQP